MKAAHGLRLVTRTPEEEAAIVRPSPAEDAKAVASFTSWKLDLLETVNADPKTDAYCVAFIEAILHFVRAKERTAYLSADTARVRAKFTKPTLIKTRSRLTALGYISVEGKTSKGVTVYRIDNPRRQIVADHMVEAAEKLREMAAERKIEERRRGKRALPPKMPKGSASFTDRGQGALPKHLEQHPDVILSEGSGSNRADPWGVLASVDREMAGIRGGLK